MRYLTLFLGLTAVISPGTFSPASSETMSSALAKAYEGNPNLNQQRAAVRAADETLPAAAAGWLPTVQATAQGGYNYIDGTLSGSTLKANTAPATVGFAINQNLFNGNRTLNNVRQAESKILGARETMRNTEQDTLLDAATAYMNVLRDTAVLDLRQNNIIVLEQQLRHTRYRFETGDVSRTDVAQASTSLSSARSDYFTARASLQNSLATYRQVIGVGPSLLEPARPIEPLLPGTLQSAIDLAFGEHPAIAAAFHAVDAAEHQVKVTEGALYPTVGITGAVQQNYAASGIPSNRYFNASILGTVSVPIYAGADAFANVRQAKELVAQARLQADQQRDAVRAAVVSA